jgi:hypothetical protein
MAKKLKSAKKEGPRARRERRFEAKPSTSPTVAYMLGGVGAAAMGAGSWAQFGANLTGSVVEPLQAAPAIMIGGALLVGAGIWLGTSAEPALRVGDAGVGVEKGPIRRIPWHAIERIEVRANAVRATGKDDTGAVVTIAAKLATQPQAAAWIVKEGRARVPGVVEVPEGTPLPLPGTDAGTTIALDPPQVVGRHCAASGKVISFEPDARVCPRCERVYHKAHVPDACACGASLASLQSEAKAG